MVWRTSYGCTWEVGKALKNLQLLLAIASSNSVLFSSSPNLPSASITQRSTPHHEPYLNLNTCRIQMQQVDQDPKERKNIRTSSEDCGENAMIQEWVAMGDKLLVALSSWKGPWGSKMEDERCTVLEEMFWIVMSLTTRWPRRKTTFISKDKLEYLHCNVCFSWLL